ncbi:MAG: hypothetical protein BWZ10_01280 [candidate division BRC1 bacterium ADurb.BinA364]|nr:MAG: hypothetical protein BWZ10_01280 [candidate division BRC1 bacterium ADurb.BinA364]
MRDRRSVAPQPDQNHARQAGVSAGRARRGPDRIALRRQGAGASPERHARTGPGRRDSRRRGRSLLRHRQGAMALRLDSGDGRPRHRQGNGAGLSLLQFRHRAAQSRRSGSLHRAGVRPGSRGNPAWRNAGNCRAGQRRPGPARAGRTDAGRRGRRHPLDDRIREPGARRLARARTQAGPAPRPLLRQSGL